MHGRASYVLASAAAAAILCGCQPLALTPDARSTTSAKAVSKQSAQQDDDTLVGRLETSTKQMTSAATRPFQPKPSQTQAKARTNKNDKNKKATATKRRKPQERSPLVAWLFPQPKEPVTLKEWLSQDRVSP